MTNYQGITDTYYEPDTKLIPGGGTKCHGRPVVMRTYNPHLCDLLFSVYRRWLDMSDILIGVVVLEFIDCHTDPVVWGQG
jgi:hypothetical protein